jgi:hypothetical protein
MGWTGCFRSDERVQEEAHLEGGKHRSDDLYGSVDLNRSRPAIIRCRPIRLALSASTLP